MPPASNIDMTDRALLPPEPEAGAPLSPHHRSRETLQLMALRRSTPAGALGEPGPSKDDLDIIMRLSMRVPDHRKLEPWRIIVIEGDARTAFGEALAAARHLREPDATPEILTSERRAPHRAPVIVCVVSSPVHDSKKTPLWEQHLSAGALCQNLLIAAQAMGWAGVWITEEAAYDGRVQAALGLDAHEQIAGFIYLGTARDQPLERKRPSLATKVTYWRGWAGSAALDP